LSIQRFYNGYRIDVSWCDKTLGFQFTIYDKDGKKVSGSIDPYCFEEYALMEAIQKVDAIIGRGD
jgi:hypothetical protein